MVLLCLSKRPSQLPSSFSMFFYICFSIVGHFGGKCALNLKPSALIPKTTTPPVLTDIELGVLHRCVSGLAFWASGVCRDYLAGQAARLL